MTSQPRKPLAALQPGAVSTTRMSAWEPSVRRVQGWDGRLPSIFVAVAQRAPLRGGQGEERYCDHRHRQYSAAASCGVKLAERLNREAKP